MEEENTFAGLGNSFYFCRTEDIGTERENSGTKSSLKASTVSRQKVSGDAERNGI